MAKNMAYDDVAIRKLFSKYIESFEDCERHSLEAIRSAEVYDEFCQKYISGSTLTKIQAYVKMMDTAVEFEEDGFVAGFKAAMRLLTGQELALFNQTTNSTSKATKASPEASVSTKAEEKQDGIKMDKYITSIQIAELFEDRNFKIVRRIEKQILPLLDDESKKYFKKVEGRNACNKPMFFYRMNRTACEIYIRQMDTKMYCINVAGGCAKLRQLMDRVFPIPANAKTT